MAAGVEEGGRASTRCVRVWRVHSMCSHIHFMPEKMIHRDENRDGGGSSFLCRRVYVRACEKGCHRIANEY